MEPKTLSPTFTVSLRGYDRMEVDEYLDSLSDALGQVEHSREQVRQHQAVIAKLKGRIVELEDRINSDTPRTGAVLGERIGLLLRQAEDTAADTIRRGEDRAAELIAESNRKLADAEDEAAAIVARADEQARRTEAAARAEADEVIADAERRATVRTRDIEQWADQTISRTRADEAKMRHEQDVERQRAMSELRDLAAKRDAVAATLADLREALGNALGLVVDSPSPTVAASVAPASLTEALHTTDGYTSQVHQTKAGHQMASPTPAPPDLDFDPILDAEADLMEYEFDFDLSADEMPAGGTPGSSEASSLEDDDASVPHLSLVEGGLTPVQLYDVEADATPASPVSKVRPSSQKDR
jgi:DivIVA domain-containing protein